MRAFRRRRVTITVDTHCVDADTIVATRKTTRAVYNIGNDECILFKGRLLNLRVIADAGLRIVQYAKRRPRTHPDMLAMRHKMRQLVYAYNTAPTCLDSILTSDATSSASYGYVFDAIDDAWCTTMV